MRKNKIKNFRNETLLFFTIWKITVGGLVNQLIKRFWTYTVTNPEDRFSCILVCRSQARDP